MFGVKVNPFLFELRHFMTVGVVRRRGVVVTEVTTVLVVDEKKSSVNVLDICVKVQVLWWQNK